MRSFTATRTFLAAAVFLASMAVAALPLQAATITMVNNDGSGEGFNDVTEVSPIAGNQGFTLGQQRLIAAQYAADLWGEILDSDVEIRVAATFDELPCNSSGAVLGYAGPNCTHMNFTGAPVADTLYPAALANKLFGADLCPENAGCSCPTDDITASFSSSLGGTCALALNWYYGLNENPGDGQVDFVTVFMHELGHGLGFLTYVDPSTGKKLQGYDDAFMRYLEEHASGLTWDQMSFNVQRMASALDNFGLHWVGENAVAAGDSLSFGRDEETGHLYMYAPETLQPGSSVSHFDISMWPNELMEPAYTNANHEPNLASELFVDIGWGPLRPPGVCGDGTVDLRQKEECDDSGESATCNADCTEAACGDGVTNESAGEDCDDVVESKTCDSDCTTAVCGDGTVNITAGEECDDAGESVDCDSDCTEPLCGDEVVNASRGETCDDGNLTDGDDCDSNCTVTGCGNGIVTAGEVCDDGNLIDGDNCDSNCTTTACGNGIVTEGEECDGDGAGNGGETDSCNSDCTTASCGDGTVNATAGEECDDSGESDTCNADCSTASCGDGKINAAAGETCDDSGESVECNADCTVASCGDGTVNATAGEECDGAGESALCNADCTTANCGDGKINASAGEDCDDIGESETCDADCTTAICGDYLINRTAGEVCDGGGESVDCNVDCTPTACGDNKINATAGETCDDGNLIDDDGCDSNCTPTGCGNGVITTGEVCDDGNTADGDGCDSACTLEDGWDCSGAPTSCNEICGDDLVVGAEDCEDGNEVDGDGCDSNCTFTGCGNGITTDGEDCDDGGESADCNIDCTISVCGDNKINATDNEECDDGGESATCDGDCTLAGCGDGTINATAGESCDDGNATDGDDCDSNCTPTGCGNGIVTPDEVCDDGNTVTGDGCTADCLCEERVCGDADYSCKLNVNDALHALQFAVGLDVVCATWTCDINDTGAITAVDALGILRGAVHIPIETNCGEPDSVVFYFHAPSEVLGGLQLEIDYQDAAGDFVGDNDEVHCVNLIPHSNAAFNKLPGKKLAMDWVSTEGFVAPMTIARCEFEPTGHLTVRNFPVTLVDDRRLDLTRPVRPTVVVAYPY